MKIELVSLQSMSNDELKSVAATAIGQLAVNLVNSGHNSTAKFYAVLAAHCANSALRSVDEPVSHSLFDVVPDFPTVNGRRFPTVNGRR